PSKARNIGVKNAKAEVIIFMDTDVILSNDVIEKLIEMFKNKSINVVASMYDTKNHYNNFISDYENLYISYTYHNLVDFAPGFYSCFAAMRKTVFNDIGGFNENLRMCEDTEFGHRLLRKGYKTNLNKTLVVSHIKNYSISAYFKKQLFKMESLLKIKKLYFGQDHFTKTLNTPFLFQLGIPISLLIPLGLIFSSKAVLLGLLLLFIFNYKMLFFMTKKRNSFFLLKAYFFMVINYWFYFISLVYGSIKLIK
ncbi:MAG: glycosyltransferase, partial [Nanoarchaeota archaeon]